MRAYALFVAAVISAACSTTPSEDAGQTSCTTHAGATFELGTGNDRWLGALQAEQELQMERGSQGGCHLPLAFRTDGFAQRRFTVIYKLSFARDGDEIIHSRETRNLQPRADAPGKCELLSFRAFVLEPWEVENERVRVEIDVEDDLGAMASTEVTVLATWPDEVAGVRRENLCGLRPQTDASVSDTGSGDGP